MPKQLNNQRLTNVTNKLVSALIVLIPFHAFLTVVSSSLLGHYTLIRLWDEMLLALILVMVVTILSRDRRLLTEFISSTLVKLILLYCLVTIVWGVIALITGSVEIKALGYAVIVNLRFLLWFLAILIVRHKTNGLERLIIIPMVLVIVFALLQFFAFPNKFLANFGYDSLVNIAPETTINKTSNIIRAQSFLRGPNPLGAYLLMGIGLVLATLSWRKSRHIILLIGLVAALLVTFSRSAWIGAFMTVAIVGWTRLEGKRARTALVSLGALLIVVTGGFFFLFRNEHHVQSIFLHVHDGSGQIESSNEGHASAFQDGMRDVLSEPLGRGPGTAGPASLYNVGHEQRNSESYFLQIGQELGWFGLALFITINVLVWLALWHRRASPLALGLAASLIGLTAVNQLSYAWSDDTLSYLWWGLAAAVLALVPSNKAHDKLTRKETDA